MPEVDYGVALTRMLLSLAACIVLLVISVWFLRRLMQSRFQRSATNQQSIQVLEKRMISPKSALYLVEIEGKKMLVAESQIEVKLKFLTEEKVFSLESEKSEI